MHLILYCRCVCDGRFPSLRQIERQVAAERERRRRQAQDSLDKGQQEEEEGGRLVFSAVHDSVKLSDVDQSRTGQSGLQGSVN